METKTLGEIATYINGYAFKPTDRGTVGLPIIRIQDLTGNGYDLAYYNGEYPSKIEINDGDILISWSGSLGVYEWNKGKALLNQHIFKVVFDKEPVEKKYFIYAIKKSLASMSAQTHGATMKHITKKDFDKVVIPFPSIVEQQTISNNLAVVEELIENYKKQLEKLDALAKSRFVEMFGEPHINPMGWVIHPLSDVLNVIGGYAFKSTEFDEDHGIPVLRIGNINTGHFKRVNMVYRKEDSNLNRYLLYPGDLVMSLTGTVGKDDYGNVCILRDDFDKYYLNQRNAKLEIKKEVDKHYLSELLSFDMIKKRLTGINRGIRQANISNKDILELRVPIPPISLQKEYGFFVEEIDKSKSVIQKSLDEAQLLFDSLMQEYFG